MEFWKRYNHPFPWYTHNIKEICHPSSSLHVIRVWNYGGLAVSIHFSLLWSVSLYCRSSNWGSVSPVSLEPCVSYAVTTILFRCTHGGVRRKKWGRFLVSSILLIGKVMGHLKGVEANFPVSSLMGAKKWGTCPVFSKCRLSSTVSQELTLRASASYYLDFRKCGMLMESTISVKSLWFHHLPEDSRKKFSLFLFLSLFYISITPFSLPPIHPSSFSSFLFYFWDAYLENTKFAIDNICIAFLICKWGLL